MSVMNENTILPGLAESMFKAYNAEGPNPNKTWDGKDVPPWDQLGEQAQRKWKAAALEALEYLDDKGYFPET